MTDTKTRNKWDRAAENFDLMASRGPELRWAPVKKELFANMSGKILFLALGTGLDICHFPPGQQITAIDISPNMIEKARARVDAYEGDMEARVMDVNELELEDHSFDQVFTSCTFCSVPNPIHGLKSLKRVLKPGGELFMFEHTGSRYFPFSLMLHLMTPMFRRFGPEMNRPTVENVKAAGFSVTQVNNIFLDVVKTIKAAA